MHIQQSKLEYSPKKYPSMIYNLQVEPVILFYFISQFCDVGEVVIIHNMVYSQMGYKENESKKFKHPYNLGN
jgi:hypothetical protein